jgi:hypothetical protein
LKSLEEEIVDSITPKIETLKIGSRKYTLTFLPPWRKNLCGEKQFMLSTQQTR